METSGPARPPRSGSIAGEFVQARVNAFGRANATLRLCKPCLAHEVRTRRLMLSPERSGDSELVNPLRDWCFVCGVLSPTFPALPRAPRSRRAAA